MKKLLLSIFLLAQFAQHAPEAVRGQSAAPAPAGASQQATTTTPVAGQAGALTEADSLSAKVVQLYQAGKFDEALPLAERVVKLLEAAAGQEHQSVAVALKNLGAIYSAKGKGDKARPHYKRALSIYEKHPAANNKDIYNLLDALGLIERFWFANYPAARAHYERSLAIKESLLGAEHEDVIKTLYDLAELYELLGHNDKAIEMHRRVVGSREKHEATKPDDLILALNRFACLSERLDMKVETAEAKRRVDQLVAARKEKRARESGDNSIRGAVLNGKAISKPFPSYPEAARSQRISGTVTVFITLDETGRVIEAHPCGHPLLSESSVRAAFNARFEPTLLDGKPVKVRGMITYKFHLR